MSAQEMVRSDIGPSDEVARQELQTYREYLIKSHLEGFTEIDGLDHDEEEGHPDFDAKLLYQRLGAATRLRVVVIPVREDLAPWGMDLRENDNPLDVLKHPYGYGSKRGVVPKSGDISNRMRAA